MTVGYINVKTFLAEWDSEPLTAPDALVFSVCECVSSLAPCFMSCERVNVRVVKHSEGSVDETSAI